MDCRVDAFSVNDSFLKKLKKIKLTDIKNLVHDVLVCEGFTLLDIDFVWLKFHVDVLYQMKLYSSQTDDMHSMHLMLLQKEGKKYIGVYQVFGGKLYVMSEEGITMKLSVKRENVQFPSSFFFDEIKNMLAEVYVCRTSRCYRVRRGWMSGEVVLKADHDRLVKKKVASDRDNSPEYLFVRTSNEGSKLENFTALTLF